MVWDGLIARADDLAAVGDLLHAVGRPPHDARNRKEGRIQFAREVEHVVHEAGVEVHVGADALINAPLFGDQLGGCLRHVFAHLVFLFLVLFRRQFFGKGFQDVRARVGEGVHRVAHAVYEAGVVICFFIEDLRHKIFEFAAVKVGHVLLDTVEHLAYLDVRAAVLGPLQRAERRRHRRIGVCAGRGDHVRGKGRVVAAAVLRMQNEAQVEHFRFQSGKFAVVAQHVEDVFRGGKVLLRLVDKEGGVRVIVSVSLLAVYGQKRKLRDQLERLAQYVLFGYVVRARIVGVEGENTARQHVHHVARGRLHDDIPHEGGGQAAEIRQDLAEALEVCLRRQVAEQKQEGRLFKGKAPPDLPGDQIADADAAVVQLAVDGDFIAVCIFAERLDLRDLRQAADDAVAVYVAQAALDVVFFV